MVKMMKKRCLQPPNPPRYSLRRTAHAIRSAEYPTLFAPPPAPLIEAVPRAPALGGGPQKKTPRPTRRPGAFKSPGRISFGAWLVAN